MSQIKINFSGIEESISSLNTIVSNYSDLLEKATAVKTQASSGWKGKAASAWTKVVEWVVSQCKESIKAINEFMRYARNVAADFESLDRDCATLINNSFD